MTHGVRQIVRFNWPFYALAGAALLIAPPVIARLPLPGPAARVFLYAATGLAALWVVTSLVASWIVYDRSPLMRWDWLPRALGFTPGAWINIHSGLDESTPALRALFGAEHGRVFDMFDPGADDRTDPSAGPAFARFASFGGASPMSSDRRPSTSVICRSRRGRSRRRSSCSRRTSCAPTRRGWRSSPSCAACSARAAASSSPSTSATRPTSSRSGPAFLHFHSRRTWTRCFSRTRFDIHAEFPITPFVRVFVLRRLT